MPYVPSRKTDGEAPDREVLDKSVEAIAQEAAGRITNNFSLIRVYKDTFHDIAKCLAYFVYDQWQTRSVRAAAHSGEAAVVAETMPYALANDIYEVSQIYGYEGAFLGELNYAITRFIQRVPQIKIANGDWKESDELRYWLYACTVDALISMTQLNTGLGISGVFEDIKDEYKRRVNTAYEAAQIVKSGDCYDAPYYTRLVEVRDESGKLVGHQEIMLKRSESTLSRDILDGAIILRASV